jgi:hypothetical protein
LKEKCGSVAVSTDEMKEMIDREQEKSKELANELLTKKGNREFTTSRLLMFKEHPMTIKWIEPAIVEVM